MKLPYHRFSEDYQPDAMHTVRRVVSCVINWLSQQMQSTSFEKVAEAERKIRNSNSFDEGVMFVLQKEHKEIANGRIKSLLCPGINWLQGGSFYQCGESFEKPPWLAGGGFFINKYKH